MNAITIAAVAVALAMDAFAVSLAVGAHLQRVSPRQFFRLSWHFGFFQFAMPIAGWLLGSRARSVISAYDHWVAMALLLYVGGGMLRESLSRGRAPFARADPTRGVSLVMLSVATSIDALAVGISIAILGAAILWPCVVIGAVAASLTLAGMYIGNRVSRWLGRSAEAVGGLVLIGIGVRIVVTHLQQEGTL